MSDIPLFMVLLVITKYIYLLCIFDFLRTSCLIVMPNNNNNIYLK